MSNDMTVQTQSLRQTQPTLERGIPACQPAPARPVRRFQEVFHRDHRLPTHLAAGAAGITLGLALAFKAVPYSGACIALGGAALGVTAVVGSMAASRATNLAGSVGRGAAAGAAVPLALYTAWTGLEVLGGMPKRSISLKGLGPAVLVAATVGVVGGLIEHGFAVRQTAKPGSGR